MVPIDVLIQKKIRRKEEKKMSSIHIIDEGEGVVVAVVVNGRSVLNRCDVTVCQYSNV
jgi:hypothetical protein